MKYQMFRRGVVISVTMGDRVICEVDPVYTSCGGEDTDAEMEAFIRRAVDAANAADAIEEATKKGGAR